MSNEKLFGPIEKEGLRILILEDVSRDADLIQRELKRGGIRGEFLVLDSREEFLRALEGFEPDIILSDYSMPRFTGLDALEIVKEKRIDIPFVIVTGSINEETAVECMKLGADDYVLKENLQRLPRVVESVLEKKRLEKVERSARQAMERAAHEWILTFDAVADPVILLNPTGRIQRCNRACQRLFDRPFKELLGLSLTELLGPSNLSALEQLFDPARRTTEREGRIVAYQQRRFRLYSDPIRESGETVGFVCTLADITDRLQAEADLRESEERFRLLVEQAPDAILLFDVDENRIVQANAQAENLLGYPREELLKLNPFQLYIPVQPDGKEAETTVRGNVAKILEGEVRPVERLIRRADGQEVFCEVRGIRLPSADRRLVRVSLIDISERKRKEAELQRLIREWDVTFDASSDGICLLDREQRILRCNRAMARIAGREKRSLEGAYCWEVVHGTPGPIPDCPFSRGARNLQRETAEIEQDGRWFEVTVDPIVEGEGHWQGSVHNLRDITERRRIAEALRDSETSYRRLYESLTDAYVKVDLAGRIIHYNEAYRRMLGYSEEELSTRTYVDLTPGKWHALEQGIVKEQILVRGASDLYEKEYRRKDGTVFPIELRTYLIRDETGKPEAMWAIIRDISERKRVESERQLLISAIEQSAETVVITDPQGTIQYVNPAFTAVSGYSREDALGRNPRLLKSGRQDEAFYRDLWETISAGKTWAGRLVNQRKDGSLYTEDATISPVFDSTGKTTNYVAVKKDVSEHLRLSREKEELQGQFLQAQKLESIGRLAGGVAHDFNNLLLVINGYSELALDRLAENDPLRADLQDIRRAGGRAAALTRQLLAFSRKQILKPEFFTLNGVISGVEKMLRRVIGEDVELKLLLDPDLGLISADVGQMEQVLMNLAVNARDAMPQGGRLTIATREVTVTPEWSGRVPEMAAGTYVQLEISDTGQGMDPETQSHIFEPFFTTKDKDRGTGLGLSTVYGIIKQSSGHIEVSSQLGQGTLFRIFLPWISGEEGLPELKSDRVEPAGGWETVLVVEDEGALRALTEKILRDAGYRVLTAAEGRDALETIGRCREPIHLLLTDVVLPQMSGPELAEQLQGLLPELKVIFMSGYATDILQDYLKSGKPIVFIPKPFERTALLDLVRKTLG